jgi:hypothetical protein
MPQGEATGPLPGARQGLNFQMSAMEPGTASMLVVMYFGSSAPSILSGSKPGARSLAQWSRLGSRVPLPSAALQPIETPWLNQKHDWPEEHSSVPLPQWQVYGLCGARRRRQPLSAQPHKAVKSERTR